jgi:GcrA cell cycle regulator
MKSLRRRQKWADLTPEAKAEISARQAAYRLMQKALDDAHRSTLGEEPTGFECTLLELNDDRCKYPKGDPGEAGFAFCGAQPRHTSPYCRFHSSLCFLPTQARAPRPYVHSERSA